MNRAVNNNGATALARRTTINKKMTQVKGKENQTTTADEKIASTKEDEKPAAAKSKGLKRATSDTQVNSRKRTAFGDITNAIQSHANRISQARKKETEKGALKPQKPAQPKRTSNRLKASKATTNLPAFTICVDAEEKSAEQAVTKEVVQLPTTNKEDAAVQQAAVQQTDVSMTEEDSANVSIVPDGLLPFDQDDDPEVVSEYARSIFKNMRIREVKFPISDYLCKPGSLTTGAMRGILVDWLVEVQENFQLYHETLYLTVKLIDSYLQHRNTKKEFLQLVGATALFIACKIEEFQAPPLDDFQYICDDAYTKKNFLEMEIRIFKTLDFDINIPVAYRYLRRFARVTSMGMELLTLSRYILELSLQEAVFIVIPSSQMAAGCLCLAMKMTNEDGWDINHVYHTGYKEEELVVLMKQLNQMLIDVPNSKLRTITTKYSHHVHFSVAKTKPLAEDAFDSLNSMQQQ